jgi:ABC-type glycerol-3-phosphate transport system substrate-binding protein
MIWLSIRYIALFFLAAAFTTGCDRGAPPAPRTLSSIHMSGVYADAARSLAAEFEKETGIQVRIVEATLFSLREKELTDLLTQAGNFEVMQVPHQWEGEILPHLRCLDDVVGRIAPDLQDFIPAVRTNCGQWQQHIYGLPLACDAITLVYRKDIFAARSAEFERLTGRPLVPPRTWQEYLEIARFLNSESLYGNIIMGGEQLYTLWSGILFGLGGRPVDEEWRPTLNSPVGVESLALFAEMFRYAPPQSESRELEEANKLFLQGRGAMYLTWPSLLWAQMRGTNTSKFAAKIGAAVIPGGKPQLSSWCLGINPACKDLDAAYRWVAFFVNQSTAKRLLLEHGKGSPRLSTYDDPQCKQEVFYLAPLLDGFRGAQPRFRIPLSQELTDYLDSELVKAIRGQSTPSAALDRTASRWREILKQTGYLRD